MSTTLDGSTCPRLLKNRLPYENATINIRDLCCHLQANEAPLNNKDKFGFEEPWCWCGSRLTKCQEVQSLNLIPHSKIYIVINCRTKEHFRTKITREEKQTELHPMQQQAKMSQILGQNGL